MNRADFLNKMVRMATPVLDAASKGELRKKMTVEQKPGAGRENFAGLEAVARLINGMSPWFEAEICDAGERELRDKLLDKARLAISGQVDPLSDDFTDYTKYGGRFSQILVDTAFLAQLMLRAPNALWQQLPQGTKENVIKLFEAARQITPGTNNWMLFSTEVELQYGKVTGNCAERVIMQYFNMLDSWYFGDGWYGDGPHFATDYYNSLVIHPMLLDLCDNGPDLLPAGSMDKILSRAQRHGEVLENLVTPDGTYIATGRSLAYRCGVFHLLAQLLWQKRLPASISEATAREVLYTVAEKTLTDESYKEDGFLNIGINKSQPNIGETYICTGSLYMASAVFLPLGRASSDEMWTAKAEPWTQRSIWGK